ncbi:barren protein [Colletotrichum abscissum]|uniref:barren protein n=1 Tax=Colletotrichum abscissum TaxID=1671311 RepID=UPI0027D6B4B7|nr:barren protein [Colletotrichum abscissum]KAK1492871.1 barren protein [Colletotrichum abscissum]
MESVTDTCFIFNELLVANASHPPDSIKTRATELRFIQRQHLHTLSQRDNQSDLLAKIASPKTMRKTKLRRFTGQTIPSTISRSEFEAGILAHCYHQPKGCLKETKFGLEKAVTLYKIVLRTFGVIEHSTNTSNPSCCGPKKYWRLDKKDGAACGNFVKDEKGLVIEKTPELTELNIHNSWAAEIVGGE